MANRAANIAHGGEAIARTVGVAVQLPIDVVSPNSYNPNVQSEWMFEKELASIEQFGFVDPLIVRHLGEDLYEIIDGEHRWKAAKQLGYTDLPCWNLGEVEDDEARQLTIVLNETRGQADDNKLRTLLTDLLARRSEKDLRLVLPFTEQRFDDLANRRQLDWDAVEQKRDAMKEAANARWKELVFRLPADAAAVVEDALDRLCAKEGLGNRWQALEMLAADSLG